MLEKEVRRRKPVKRPHGEVVGTAVMDSKLFLEVFQREEGMTGIKTLLILVVTALHFAVVPWSIRTDQSVSNPQISGSFLKQGHAVTLAVGKMGTASLL